MTDAAAPLSPPVGAWKPISEAPKDGTVVDLWYARGPFRMTDARWRDGDWWFVGEAQDEHWRVTLGDGPALVQPTHFMPLPPPPIDVKAEGET